MTFGKFFQGVRNLYSVVSISDNFSIHIHLRRVSKQQVGGLSPLFAVPVYKSI